MINNLNLDQIRFLFYTTSYLHDFITGIVILAFILTFIFKRIWQLYLILGLFFLQQAIFDGCILSYAQNHLAQPLGIAQINNQFMFGLYNGQYLGYYRILSFILGLFYLYMCYWCIKKNYTIKKPS